MKWLTIPQPNSLPYSGFFSKVLRSDGFVILDHVQFSTEQKRNIIDSKNGTIQLSLQISSRTSSICDLPLSKKVLKKHWASIEQSYNKHPFFDPRLKELYNSPPDMFADFTASIILWVLQILEWDGPIWRSSKILPQDYDLKNNDMIVDICNILGFEGYISGTGAKDYIDTSKFKSIIFNEYKPIKYDTPHGPSKDNMSVLDPLFCIGPKELKSLLQNTWNTPCPQNTL